MTTRVRIRQRPPNPFLTAATVLEDTLWPVESSSLDPAYESMVPKVQNNLLKEESSILIVLDRYRKESTIGMMRSFRSLSFICFIVVMSTCCQY